MRKRITKNRETVLIAVLLLSALSTNAHAYLDPGSGSFIFQVMIGALLGALVTIKIYWQRLKSYFSRLFSKKDAETDR